MINKLFRVPDSFTLEDALEHKRIGPILQLASNYKVQSKYDCRFINANFTEGNWMFALVKNPDLGKTPKKLDDYD